MPDLVSLLDPAHYALVEGLRAELAERLGVHSLALTPYPHLSYQVAGQSDPDQLRGLMQGVATTAEPFQVRATGLGIFTGANPMIYIPIVHNLALRHFHERIWTECSAPSTGLVPYYHPDNWLPHITLGRADSHADNLPAVIDLLGPRTFEWDIRIDNLALIWDTGTAQELRGQWAFGGAFVRI
jgi:2'-5' RNA ligase